MYITAVFCSAICLCKSLVACLKNIYQIRLVLFFVQNEELLLKACLKNIYQIRLVLFFVQNEELLLKIVV